MTGKLHRGAVRRGEMAGAPDISRREEGLPVLPARASPISPTAPATGTPARVNMK